jgi:adenine-specific DNA-methyltransferase
MAHEKLKPNFVFDEEKISKLKQLAPECFEDGKINFETLKQNLGEWSEEEDESIEQFGLFWPGKKLARRAATLPPEGTLEPVFGDGLKPDGTSDEDGNNPSKNIFIEGENLEVLKLLQKSYADKIKMIYIDPPYNTGNDFVYDDDFTEPLQEYLRRTGQIDEEGKSLTTNKRSDGRFHSKWLNMMYPRLRLARNLLKEDGVIFVSIDDNELTNLKMILNEIFGDENFLGCITIVSNLKGRSDDKYFATAHNYLLAFGKNDYVSKGIQLPSENENDYNEKDEKGRKYRIQGLRKRGDSSKRTDRPKMFFPLYINPKTQKVSVIKSSEFCEEVIPKLSDGIDGRWRWGLDTVKDRIDELIGRQVGKENRWDVFQIDYYENEKGIKRVKPKTVWLGSEYSNEAGGLEFKKIMGHKAFDTPKPLGLLLTLFEITLDDDDIVLDFFAGSGTLGEAILEFNERNKFNCKYIAIQIPVLINSTNEAFKLGFKKITDITRERLFLASIKYKKGNPIIFQLSNSNFKKWSDYKGQDVEQLTAQFEDANSPFAPDWNKNKLFTEILLLEGFPLDAQVEEMKIGDNEIKKVSSELISNQLLICLDEKIDTTIISDLKIDYNSSFICLDSAITNQDKLRLSDKGLIKTI